MRKKKNYMKTTDTVTGNNVRFIHSQLRSFAVCMMFWTKLGIHVVQWLLHVKWFSSPMPAPLQQKHIAASIKTNTHISQ